MCPSCWGSETARAPILSDSSQDQGADLANVGALSCLNFKYLRNDILFSIYPNNSWDIVLSNIIHFYMKFTLSVVPRNVSHGLVESGRGPADSSSEPLAGQVAGSQLTSHWLYRFPSWESPHCSLCQPLPLRDEREAAGYIRPRGLDGSCIPRSSGNKEPQHQTILPMPT